ncbi:MAG: glycosyltransferase family 4 protein [Bacillota bacterium]
MHVVLVAPPSIPVPPKKYGGTQRDVCWLATGLSELGHDVTVLAKEGSYVNERVEIIEIPEDTNNKEYLKYLPQDFDIVNFHVKIGFEPDFPYLHSMHGNAKENEFLPQNTSFISQSHAKNHGGEYYAYNGLDLRDYEFSQTSKDYFSFIGKISVDHKNLSYTLDLAKKLDFNLKIAGGWRLSFRSNIEYLGMVGGQEKIDFLKEAKALIFPTAWEEPMGLVVIESLACGTPVIVSDRGAMPELVTEDVGFVCKTEADYIKAINNIDQINRKDCRNYIEDNFTHRVMAQNYLELYQMILNDQDYQLNKKNDLNQTINTGHRNMKKISIWDKIMRIFK